MQPMAGHFTQVDPKEETQDFELEETLRKTYVELERPNKVAADLAVTIAFNFEELGL